MLQLGAQCLSLVPPIAVVDCLKGPELTQAGMAGQRHGIGCISWGQAKVEINLIVFDLALSRQADVPPTGRGVAQRNHSALVTRLAAAR